MRGATFQKAENKSYSMVTPLFRKENNTVSDADHLSMYKTTGNPSFNFGNISIFNPVNNLRIQPKLQINQPGDKYEQEADTIAEKVMKITDKELNPSMVAISKDADNKKIKRKEKSPGPAQADSALDSYINTLGSSGSPLTSTAKQFMNLVSDMISPM